MHQKGWLLDWLFDDCQTELLDSMRPVLVGLLMQFSVAAGRNKVVCSALSEQVLLSFLCLPAQSANLRGGLLLNSASKPNACSNNCGDCSGKRAVALLLQQSNVCPGCREIYAYFVHALSQVLAGGVLHLCVSAACAISVIKLSTSVWCIS